MIDQKKVTSGFDVEFLMGEEYIRYFLLCSLETGSIPWWSETIERDSAGNVTRHDATITHPPAELEQRRLYPAHPDFVGNEHPFQALVPGVYSIQGDEEFRVTILPDGGSGADIRLKIFPSILQDLHTPTPKVLISNLAPLDLDIRFDVAFRQRADGLLDDIGLQLELLDISGPLIDAAQNQPGFSKEETLQDMKRQIDRRVPFAMSGGGALQRIETRKFLDEEGRPNAIGIYINLALQDGPEPDSLLADRGDASLAQNFLEPGEKMGFAFPKETYSRLGKDFKFKMAVPKEDDPGKFHYPIMDGDDKVGKIKGISVKPERSTGGPGGPSRFTNVLVIDIHGEYEIEDFFDPDFHLLIRLVPTVDENGVFDFDVDFDLSMSAAAYLIAIFVTTALIFVFPKLGLTLLSLSILTLKIIEKVGEGLAQSAIQAELDRSSFLDALPHKLLVELRRWDPLYFTHHRVETGGVDIQVNQHGFALDAREMFVGRAFSPLQNMVIRSETRDADGALDGLVYRANDLRNFLDTDLVNTFAATDRMPHGEILPPEGHVESYRVPLSLEQIAARMAAGDRHLKEIDYLPKKVDVIEHQIFQILTVSTTEIPEIEAHARSRLRSEVRASHGAAFRQQAIEELTDEFGTPPSEADIAARVNQLLELAVAAALPSMLRTELDHHMSFDLEPHEFADLQKKKILVLGRDHLEIRKMRRETGEVIFYRDYERPFEPNTDKRDNLLSLPRYKHEGLTGSGPA